MGMTVAVQRNDRRQYSQECYGTLTDTSDGFYSCHGELRNNTKNTHLLYAHTQTHTFPQSLSYTHTLSLSLSLSFYSISLPHSLTRSYMHIEQTKASSKQTRSNVSHDSKSLFFFRGNDSWNPTALCTALQKHNSVTKTKNTTSMSTVKTLCQRNVFCGFR